MAAERDNAPAGRGYNTLPKQKVKAASRMCPRKPTLPAKAELFSKMETWPKTWSVGQGDLTLGRGLVGEFHQFVEHLQASGLAAQTVQRHFDNLWLLGGKIVSDAGCYGELDIPAAEHLDKVLDAHDGPLISDLGPEEQREFDGTCRKFFRFRQR